MQRDVWETKVRSIKTTKQIQESFLVMRQLRTHQTKENYVEIAMKMITHHNYYMFGLYDPMQDWKLLSVIGFTPALTLSNGRIVWIQDLVTDEVERSKGYGEHLLAFVEEEWAKRYDYDAVILASDIEAKRAHHFYTKYMNYKKVSYLFMKDVT